MIVIDSRHFEDVIRICAGLARARVEFTCRFISHAAEWHILLSAPIPKTV